MRRVERRTVEAALVFGGSRRILEVDEEQHFNQFRAITLRHYAGDVRVAFDTKRWLEQCDAKTRLEGGGFAAPRPPLFPGLNRRHRQRAFRDALRDLVPTEHGYAPTLRIGAFEIRASLRPIGLSNECASWWRCV